MKLKFLFTIQLNDLILNMTPKNQEQKLSDVFKSWISFMFISHVSFCELDYIICELDPLVACAELFQAHVCCFSSTSKLSIAVNENSTPHAHL